MSEASVYQEIRRYWKHQYNQSQRSQHVMYSQLKKLASRFVQLPPGARAGWMDAMQRDQRACSDYAALLNRFKSEGTDGKDKT